MMVSVVIRSYQRPEALKALVRQLQQQRYPTFEVVILEQSENPRLVKDINSWGDSRIRVITAKPLDAPAARNQAIRHSSGEILLFIDDDDLPIGEHWITQHARNYQDDPYCMGVVGRLVADPTRMQGPRFPRLVRLFAMRHTLFKDTMALAHNTLRKENIDFLIGSNASVRRSLVERIGGWDEGIPMNEEQSFAIKFSHQRRHGERFVFDPEPTMWRRTDIPGGLNRRARNDWHLRELEARLFYYKHVVGHYFPFRYRLLYPLFVSRGVEQSLLWIWDADNRQRSARERVRASFELITELPAVMRSERFSSANVRRVEGCPSPCEVL